LIEDSRAKYKMSQREGTFIAGKNDNEILIVYPFEGDRNIIEASALDLNELSYKCTYNNQVRTETTSRVGRTQATIWVEDYEKLEIGVWLNDTLVNFWMKWISRDKPNDVHFFTAHFHATLESEGVERVKSWTARNNINIFGRKLLFMPSCRDGHWSLCVIVNPGAITRYKSDLKSGEEDDKAHSLISCILFFDSLKMHCKLSSQILLLKWLNSEWQRVNDTSTTPFTIKSCIIYNPEGTFELPHVMGFHGNLSLCVHLFIDQCF
jgi:Ulp1 family protease